MTTTPSPTPATRGSAHPGRLRRMVALYLALPLMLGAALPARAEGSASTAAGTTAARSTVAPGGAAGQARFEWPLHPVPPVVRSFDRPDDPYGPGHRGVDLGARAGQPVLAAGAGVVIFAGNLAGRGVVSVDHDALRTTYEPLRPEVKVGEQVYAGQRIGTVMAGHRECERACLHWGVRRGNPPEYLDPLELVGPISRVRLKPWAGQGVSRGSWSMGSAPPGDPQPARPRPAR